jgi:nitric oxide reductase NorD protein
MTQEDMLRERLRRVLDPRAAAELLGDLARTVGEQGHMAALLDLLDELQRVSAKCASLAIEQLPEFRRRCGLQDVVIWLDLGATLAASSGAMALRYFKESPLIVGLIEPAMGRRPIMQLCLELADSDPGVALEFLRTSPELLTITPIESLPAWAEIGVDLAGRDYVLAIEYLKHCPRLAQLLSAEQARTWANLGSKLIGTNSLGKPDYVGTLEFFRLSPGLLAEYEERPVRLKVLGLGDLLADRDPGAAMALLAEAGQLLQRLPDEGWRLRVLRYGELLGERDAETALAYLRRCPEIVALLGGSVLAEDKVEEWFASGMEILQYSQEGARAYFALETRKALASVEQAMNGVPLRQMARQLRLFAQGLCGSDVRIQALPGTSLDETHVGQRATVAHQGRIILLPELIRRYPTKEENARLYAVMTAHEAGHLEFGTYRLSLAQLSGLIADVFARYCPTRSNGSLPEMQTLQQLFDLYPQPLLIRDLWTIVEDARVEFCLRSEYPGLKRDLTILAREAASTRSLTQGLTVRELVVDYLLLLTTQEPETVRVLPGAEEMVQAAWALVQTIMASYATAADAVMLADRLYVLLERMIAVPEKAGGTDREQMDADGSLGPKATETMACDYRPVTNWSYRGSMQPDLIGGSETDRHVPEDPVGSQAADRLARESDHEPARELIRGRDEPAQSVQAQSLVDWRHRAAQRPDEGIFYDEWDGTVRDYRSAWCRVLEQHAEEGSADFVNEVLTRQAPSIRRLRRYFESLRPPAWRRMHGRPDGEEIDLDAVVRRVADRRAGVELSDRIYLRREKQDRDVAAMFLLDLSGSTSRQIDPQGRRVIDVEKEGLVLLTEALEAIGDQFAIYAYSGRGRDNVRVIVIKDFDEPASQRVACRIGSISPLQQNRDGAAIRHATRKLLERTARTKLLILISDGKPLDAEYADEYALEDTKMALREARQRNIEPFCITVDRESSDYLRRMYGDVRFLILDRAELLPDRLPGVYQRLTR